LHLNVNCDGGPHLDLTKLESQFDALSKDLEPYQILREIFFI